MDWLKETMDWSEVWSPIIPLVVFLIVRPSAKWVRPIVLFLIFICLCSIIVDITWKSKRLGIQEWSEQTFWWLYKYIDGKKELYNTLLYNVMSVARVLLFTWFFYIINKPYKRFYQVIFILFTLFVILNFGWFQNIQDFSSRMLAADAALLLLYCMLFLYKVNLDDEISSPMTLPESWVVTGLILYASVNFMIFLFYSYLIKVFEDYAIDVWNVHNALFIIMNIFISIAFVKAKRIKLA